MTDTTNDAGNTRPEDATDTAQSACNGLLCDSCFHEWFHPAGSYQNVVEGYDDPYNYWYCAEGHWGGDICGDKPSQKDDPWRNCPDYRARGI